MKMIDIVQEIISQGHKVEYRVRSDGGIIVKSIDGVKYKDLTTGNKVARSMVVGGELSTAKIEQRRFNVNKYIKLKEGEKKKVGDIDKDMMTKLRRVQRIRREYGRKEEGKVSKKKLRWYVKTYGEKRAMEYLENRERYYRGYANKENVDFLVTRIRRLKHETSKPKEKAQVEHGASSIESHWEEFQEKWIYPCHEASYGIAKTVMEKLQDLKDILPTSWF